MLPCSTSLLNWHRKCCVIFKLLMLLHLLQKDLFDALVTSCEGIFCSQVVSVLSSLENAISCGSEMYFVESLKYLHNMIMIKWNEMWEFLVSVENLTIKVLCNNLAISCLHKRLLFFFFSTSSCRMPFWESTWLLVFNFEE
jgi:hypothetical protein